MLKGYKTYVTGALAILTAVGAYLTGDLAISDAIQVIVPAIMGMTLRNAIPKAKEVE